MRPTLRDSLYSDEWRKEHGLLTPKKQTPVLPVLGVVLLIGGVVLTGSGNLIAGLVHIVIGVFIWVVGMQSRNG
jgi:hypothetical protein